MRVLGLDEPASVVFSVLNLLGHVVGLYRLRSIIPATAPMANTWQLYSLVGEAVFYFLRFTVMQSGFDLLLLFIENPQLCRGSCVALILILQLFF